MPPLNNPNAMISPIEICANGQKVTTLRLETAIGRAHLARIHPDSKFYSREQFKLSRSAIGWMISPLPGTVNQTLVDNAPLVTPRPVVNGMTVHVRGASGLILELQFEGQIASDPPKPPPAFPATLWTPRGELPQPPFDPGTEYYCGKCHAVAFAAPCERGWGFCSNCKALVHFLEESVSQRLMYPWQFLSRLEWPHTRTSLAARGSRERVEEIWMDVAKTLRYEEDSKRFSGRSDVWQTANESLSLGVGDCEDHSILLASWLATEGYEVRVAVGEAELSDKGWGGHAWVVLRLGGIEYLIETVRKATVRALPFTPQSYIDKTWRSFYTLETVGKQTACFRPYFVFGEEHIWTRKDYGVDSTGRETRPQSPSSYWADSEWVEGIWLRKR